MGSASKNFGKNSSKSSNAGQLMLEKMQGKVIETTLKSVNKNIESNLKIFKAIENSVYKEKFLNYEMFIMNILNQYFYTIFKQCVFINRKIKEEFNQELKIFIEKNKEKKRFNIINFNNLLNGGEYIEFSSEYIINFLEEYLNKAENYSKKKIFNTNLELDIILSVSLDEIRRYAIKTNKKILNRSGDKEFIRQYRNLITKRGSLRHPENEHNDLEFFIALLYFLPAKEMNLFLDQIYKYTLKIENNIEILKEYDFLKDINSEYQRIKKEEIALIYSKKVSKKENMDKKEKYKKQQRKRILTGELKKKEDSSVAKTQWKIEFEKYREENENFFLGLDKEREALKTNFYKITTFKKRYYFIGEQNIKNIKKYIKSFLEERAKTLQEKNSQNKSKYKNLFDLVEGVKILKKDAIKFVYLEEFHETMMNINCIIYTMIGYILKTINIKEEKHKDLKRINDSLAHNELFCLIKKTNNKQDLKEIFIFDIVKEYLGNIEKDNLKKYKDIVEEYPKTQGNENNKKIYERYIKEVGVPLSIKNEFITTIENCLYTMTIPNVYNKIDGNKRKVANVKKRKNNLANKKYFKIDDKEPLMLVAKNLLNIIKIEKTLI